MEGFLCTQPPCAGSFQLHGMCVEYSERTSCIRACWGHPRRVKEPHIESDPYLGLSGCGVSRTCAWGTAQCEVMEGCWRVHSKIVRAHFTVCGRGRVSKARAPSWAGVYFGRRRNGEMFGFRFFRQNPTCWSSSSLGIKYYDGGVGSACFCFLVFDTPLEKSQPAPFLPPTFFLSPTCERPVR